MPVVTIKPNADVSANWNEHGDADGLHWNNVNNGVDTPNDTDYLRSDGGVSERLAFEDIATGGDVQIEVGLRLKAISVIVDLAVGLYVDGVLAGSGSINIPRSEVDSSAFENFRITLPWWRQTWTQTQLNTAELLLSNSVTSNIYDLSEAELRLRYFSETTPTANIFTQVREEIETRLAAHAGLAALVDEFKKWDEAAAHLEMHDPLRTWLRVDPINAETEVYAETQGWRLVRGFQILLAIPSAAMKVEDLENLEANMVAALAASTRDQIGLSSIGVEAMEFAPATFAVVSDVDDAPDDWKWVHVSGVNVRMRKTQAEMEAL